MKANLTVILSIAGVAVLLASPTSANPRCPANLPCGPHDVYVPVYVTNGAVVAPGHGAHVGAYAYVTPRTVFGNAPGVNGVGPYTPDIPSPRYGNSGDFQTSIADR